MYPSPVLFERVDPGPGGTAIRWSAPGGIDVTRYAVYRATGPVSPEAVEAFYEGRLAGVTRQIVGPVHLAWFDRDPPAPAWYLVQAFDADGDLHEVDVRLAPIHDPSVYEDPPRLVYRDDDSKAAAAIQATARSLAAMADDS